MFRKILLYVSFVFFTVVLISSCEKDKEDSNALDVNTSTIPRLSTDSVSGITHNSAQSGGKISSNGGAEITAKGLCWSTSPNPTLANAFSIEGTGSGNFSGSISGLLIGTFYYVRAYATNNIGTAYGTQVSFSTISSLTIGSTFEGGIIFYLDSSNQHGLLCAPSDQVIATNWGCPNTQIAGADGSAIGTGAQNTIDIVNGCSMTDDYAAILCDSLVLNGYSDWFLPSKEELKAIYNNLKLSGIGSLTNNAYWSSSEMTSVFAWQVIFANGLVQGTGKNNSASVRAVRAF